MGTHHRYDDDNSKSFRYVRPPYDNNYLEQRPCSYCDTSWNDIKETDKNNVFSSSRYNPNNYLTKIGLLSNRGRQLRYVWACPKCQQVLEYELNKPLDFLLQYMTPEEADRNAIVKRGEPDNDNNSLPRRNTAALVPMDTMHQAKRKLSTCLYEIHEPISLIFLIREAARDSVYVGLAFDLSEYDTGRVSEQKLAELSENDTALWNFIRDIIEGQITFAGRKLTVV